MKFKQDLIKSAAKDALQIDKDTQTSKMFNLLYFFCLFFPSFFPFLSLVVCKKHFSRMNQDNEFRMRYFFIELFTKISMILVLLIVDKFIFPFLFKVR